MKKSIFTKSVASEENIKKLKIYKNLIVSVQGSKSKEVERISLARSVYSIYLRKIKTINWF